MYKGMAIPFNVGEGRLGDGAIARDLRNQINIMRLQGAFAYLSKVTEVYLNEYVTKEDARPA